MATADKNQQNRSMYIDFIKGIAIIGVVCLHVLWDDMLKNPFGHFVLLFMVPVFFYISGYLSSKKHGTTKNGIKPYHEKLFHTFVSLGVPYFIFCFLTTLFSFVLYLMKWQDFNLNNYLFPTILFLGIGPLWFLPPMMFGKIIFNRFENSSKLYLYGGLALVFLILFFAFQERIYSIFTRFHINRTLIFCLIHSIFAFYLMTGGYYFGLCEERCRKTKFGYPLLFAGLFLVTAVCLPFESNHISIVHLYLPNVLYLPFVALLCSVIVLFCKTLFLIPGSRYVFSPICYCGKYSLFIMVFHQDFIMPFFVHYNNTYKKLEVVAIILICLLLAPLVERFVPFCLGKGPKAKKLESYLIETWEKIRRKNK